MSTPRKSPDFVLDFTAEVKDAPTEIRRIEVQLPEGSTIADVAEVRTGRIIVSPAQMERAAAQFARRKKVRRPKKGAVKP